MRCYEEVDVWSKYLTDIAQNLSIKLLAIVRGAVKLRGTREQNH